MTVRTTPSVMFEGEELTIMAEFPGDFSLDSVSVDVEQEAVVADSDDPVLGSDDDTEALILRGAITQAGAVNGVSVDTAHPESESGTTTVVTITIPATTSAHGLFPAFAPGTAPGTDVVCVVSVSAVRTRPEDESDSGSSNPRSSTTRRNKSNAIRARTQFTVVHLERKNPEAAGRRGGGSLERD